MLIDGLHKAPLTSSGRSLPHPHALLLSLIVSSFRPCLGGAQSTAYRIVGASFPRERELADGTLRSPCDLLRRQIGCVECGRSRRGASQRSNSEIHTNQGCELTLWWPLIVPGRKLSPGHAIVG